MSSGDALEISLILLAVGLVSYCVSRSGLEVVYLMPVSLTFELGSAILVALLGFCGSLSCLIAITAQELVTNAVANGLSAVVFVVSLLSMARPALARLRVDVTRVETLRARRRRMH